MIEDDYMELGNNELVPVGKGWFYEKLTGTYIDPEGMRHTEMADDAEQ